jgi:hypothetical protein
MIPGAETPNSKRLTLAAYRKLQLDRNRRRLVIQSAWLEAELANCVQNILLQNRIDLSYNLQIKGLAALIDNQCDNHLFIARNDPQKQCGVGLYRHSVDQLRAIDSSGDSQRRASGATIRLRGERRRLNQLRLKRASGGLGLCRRIYLSVKQGGDEGEGSHDDSTHD